MNLGPVLEEISRIKQCLYALEKNAGITVHVATENEPLIVESEGNIEVSEWPPTPEVRVKREVLLERIQELSGQLENCESMREDLSVKNTELHVEVAQIRDENAIIMKELQAMKDKYEPED